MRLIIWAERSDQLVLLLGAATAQNPQSELLRVVSDALRPKLAQAVPVYRSADPYQACVLRGDVPFVDRTSLRTTLKAMISGGGAAVLAVKGERRVGKSHTSHLISHLAGTIRHNDTTPMCRTVSLSLKDQVPDFHAGDLSSQFSLQLGRPDRVATIPPQPETEQEARWIRNVAGWIAGEVRDAVRQLGVQEIWLVVDEFQQGIVAPSTREVLRRLAQMAHRDLRELRVILLDHPDALPEIERYIAREEIRLPKRDDLEDFYRLVIDGTNRPMEDTLLGQLVDATWTEAGARDEGFMERLDDAIRHRLPKLLGRN